MQVGLDTCYLLTLLTLTDSGGRGVLVRWLFVAILIRRIEG